MKKILIGSVVVIGAVAVAGAVAVQYLLDGETIANELRKEVKSRLNRELTFSGPVSIKLFPKIAVELPTTSLSYANSNKPQVTLNSASVGVMVLPLLKGEVKLDTVKIDGLKGKINVERLKAALDKRQAAVATDGASNPVEVKKGSLTFIKDFSVHGIDVFNSALTIYGLQDKKVYSFDNINLSTGPLTIMGETGIRFSADFSEKTQNLSGNVGVDTQLVYDIATYRLGLERLATHLAVNQAGVTTEVQVSTPKLAYEQGDVKAEDVRWSLMSSGETKVEGSLSLASSNRMDLWSLDDLTGQAKTRFNGKVIEVPFVGRAKGQLKTETVAASINGKLKESPFSVQVQSVGFAKPGVTGQVKLDRLVVDDWLGGTSQSMAAVGGSLVGQAWADESVDLSILTKVDANVSMNVDRVRYRGLEAESLTGGVTLRNGKLTLQNWKSGLCGGTVSGAVTLDQSARWSVSAKTSNVNTQCVANGLDVLPLLEGTAVSQINVSGIGLEPIALKKTAKGSMTAEVKKAQLKGISLEKIANAVREKSLSNLVVSKEDVTALEAMTLKASLGDGVLSVTQLTGKSSVAEVSGQAKINLLNEQLSGGITAKFGTSIGGRRVIVPIDLGGTLTEPSYRLDLSELLKGQLKEELTNPEILLKGLSKLIKR